MAYSYYPSGYQQYYPTYQPPQTNAGVTWVQGESAAKSWVVAPNTTVALWDSEAQVIYLKSADASGMPSMKVLDYTLRGTEKAQESVSAPKASYATRDEIDAIYGQIESLKAELDGLRKKRKEKEE